MLKESAAVRDSGLVDDVVLVGTHERDLPEEARVDAGIRLVRLRLRTLSWPSNPFVRIVQVFEWQVRLFLAFRRASVVIYNAHNLAALPVGALFKFLRGTGLVYDTHELESERDWPTPVRWFARRIERRLIRMADIVVVVSDATGDWYRRQYGLDNVLAVRNFPSSARFPAGRNHAMRLSLGVPDHELLFIYQGVLAKARGTGTLLDVFSRVPPDRHILFLGFGEMEAEVRAQAARLPNVHFHAAVPPDRLLEYTSAADVGFHLLDQSSLNHSLTLGNKPFEYIACGVPVIESDHTEVARLIEPHGCAWLTNGDADALVALVTRMTFDEVAGRRQLALEARHHFTWEVEAEKMRLAYVRAFGTPGAPA